MKIYTRTGDDGTSSLAGGERLPKHHPRFEAVGDTDELISWFGLLGDLKENSSRKELLRYIQGQLMIVAAMLAGAKEKSPQKPLLPDPELPGIIEKEIDNMEALLPPLKNFILPGGNIPVSYCHIARCICRRAERSVSRLKETGLVSEIIPTILNRLSDFLYVLARKLSLELDIEEVR